MKIKRSIYKELADDLNRPEVSIILGPHQVGKTFLLKELEGEAKARGLLSIYLPAKNDFSKKESKK